MGISDDGRMVFTIRRQPASIVEVCHQQNLVGGGQASVRSIALMPVEVDIIGPKAFQAHFTGSDDRVTGQPLIIRSGAHGETHLGSQDVVALYIPAAYTGLRRANSYRI